MAFGEFQVPVMVQGLPLVTPPRHAGSVTTSPTKPQLGQPYPVIAPTANPCLNVTVSPVGVIVAASGVAASGVCAAHSHAANVPSAVHACAPSLPAEHTHAMLVPKTHSGGRSTVTGASCVPASGGETTWRPPDVAGEDAPPVAVAPPVPVLVSLEPPPLPAAASGNLVAGQ